jgi:hypothetical protein
MFGVQMFRGPRYLLVDRPGCDADGVIMVQMQKKKVTTYSGNYDSYVIARAQLEENQMKKYSWEQEQVLSPLFTMPCVPAIAAACLEGSGVWRESLSSSKCTSLSIAGPFSVS